MNRTTTNRRARDCLLLSEAGFMGFMGFSGLGVGVCIRSRESEFPPTEEDNLKLYLTFLCK